MSFRSMRKGLSKAPLDIVASLDIGTSKVACGIAKIDQEGNLHVLGTGYHASRGLQNGAIVDMKGLQQSIATAVHMAEEAADITLTDLYVSISPQLTQSDRVRVDTSITGRPVDESDIGKMIVQACQSVHRGGYEMVHTIATGYTIDQTQGIRDPRGMFGDELRSHIHVISGASGPLRNLSVCLERCHLNALGFVVSCFASGLSTLVADEMDLGVTLLDMGAGSTSFATFCDGKLRYVGSVNFGGQHVTHDLARGLSTPIHQAERIKTLYGSTISSSTDEREMITIPQIGEAMSEKGPQVSKAELVRIIQPRLEEIFELIRDQLQKHEEYRCLGQRMVLTGGGSLLGGVKELASYVLDKQARIGKPLDCRGLETRAENPDFATCVGLLMYGRDELLDVQDQQKISPYTMSHLWGRFSHWLRKSA